MVYVIVTVATVGTLAALRYSRTLWRETHGWQRQQQRRQTAQQAKEA